MTDFTTYQPPGVYVEENPGDTLVGVTGNTDSVVAIVGPSIGYRVWTETITLDAEVPVALSKLGVDSLTITVAHLDGTLYDAGVDYNVSSGPGEDENPSTPSDNVVSIVRIDDGDIASGQQVRVSYRYTDPTYYNPLTASDYDDVKDAYGEPVDPSTGAIVSPLSLAAKFAFDNGAQRVILVATPGSASVVSRGDLQAGVAKLSPIYDISVIVPLPVGITGEPMAPGDTLGVATDLVNHCTSQSDAGYFRVGVIGYESSVTVAPETIAASANSARLMLSWPNKLSWYNTVSNQTVEIAGYYLAAAMAGRMASLAVQTSLTRKNIRGFVGVSQSAFVTMTKAQKDIWSSSGVAVVEFNRLGAMICRHGVSTDGSSMLTREMSLTRAKDLMVRLLQDTMDSSGLIGQAIGQDTLLRIKGVAQGVLESLVARGVIVAYNELKTRQRPADPMVVEVKFSYKPSWPLNYIVVSFTIDTTTGDVTAAVAA